MSAKKPAANAPKTVVADDPDDRKGQLKSIGGSQSDHWNNTLANQAVQALWVKNSSAEERDKQLSATVAALMGIAPKDELEGMMAAQLIAAHNAAMECYRRAMIGEQTFEGRRENLAQANKLSRTYATLLEALNRHRGKGQQKVTVEHVHGHSGGQAVAGGGWGSSETGGSTPCKADCPCTAARAAAPGRGTRARAGRQRWRTAAAGCTAACRRARRRVIRTRSSTAATPPGRSQVGARLRTSSAPCALWPAPRMTRNESSGNRGRP